MFEYDSSRDTLVIFPPAAEAPIQFRIGDLQRMGWTITSEGCRAALPRVGGPRVAMASAGALRGLSPPPAPFGKRR